MKLTHFATILCGFQILFNVEGNTRYFTFYFRSILSTLAVYPGTCGLINYSLNCRSLQHVQDLWVLFRLDIWCCLMISPCLIFLFDGRCFTSLCDGAVLMVLTLHLLFKVCISDLNRCTWTQTHSVGFCFVVFLSDVCRKSVSFHVKYQKTINACDLMSCFLFYIFYSQFLFFES